jgi:hypothetical protein
LQSRFAQAFLGLSRAERSLHASFFGLLRAMAQLACQLGAAGFRKVLLALLAAFGRSRPFLHRPCQPAPVVVFLHHFYASRLLSLYLYPQHFYSPHKTLHRA